MPADIARRTAMQMRDTGMDHLSEADSNEGPRKLHRFRRAAEALIGKNQRFALPSARIRLRRLNAPY